jgi:protein-S-isoprenylcysteine O-methyltransferase Ste14
MLTSPPPVPPPVVLCILAALAWVSARHWPLLSLAWPGARPLALAVFIVGGLCIAVAFWLFRRARTSVHPIKFSGNTRLLTQGIFAYSRNPIYLGMLLVLAAWIIELQALSAVIVWPLYFSWLAFWQVPAEEIYLEKAFGDAYRDYKKQVRRWC